MNQKLIATLLPIVGVVFVAFLVTGLALPVLPLHVQSGLGLGAFVVGLVAGAQFAAALLSRFWSGNYADARGAKRAVVAGLLLAAVAGLLYPISLRFLGAPVTSVTILLVGRAVLGLRTTRMGSRLARLDHLCRRVRPRTRSLRSSAGPGRRRQGRVRLRSDRSRWSGTDLGRAMAGAGAARRGGHWLRLHARLSRLRRGSGPARRPRIVASRRARTPHFSTWRSASRTPPWVWLEAGPEWGRCSSSARWRLPAPRSSRCVSWRET